MVREVFIDALSIVPLCELSHADRKKMVRNVFQNAKGLVQCELYYRLFGDYRSGTLTEEQPEHGIWKGG